MHKPTLEWATHRESVQLHHREQTRALDRDITYQEELKRYFAEHDVLGVAWYTLLQEARRSFPEFPKKADMIASGFYSMWLVLYDTWEVFNGEYEVKDATVVEAEELLNYAQAALPLGSRGRLRKEIQNVLQKDVMVETLHHLAQIFANELVRLNKLDIELWEDDHVEQEKLSADFQLGVEMAVQSWRAITTERTQGKRYQFPTEAFDQVSMQLTPQRYRRGVI